MKRFRKGLGAVLAAILFAGCAGLTSTEEEIAVGVVLPLSGEHAKKGEAILAGLQLAVSETNRDGGVDGRPLRLLVGDDGGSVEKTRAVMERMIATDGVSAVVGGYATSCALVMREIAETQEIPCVVVSASSVDLLKNADFMFRVGFSDATQARAMARFARERGYTRMAVLMDLDEDATYARDLGRRTGQEFFDQYGDLPLLCGYRKNDAGRLAALRKALSCNPQVIVLPSYFDETVICIRELRNMGYGGLIIGGDGAAGDYSKADVKTGDFVYTAVYSVETDYEPARLFAERFREANGRVPESCEAMGYDAGKVLAIAFRGARSESNAAANLRSLRTFSSVIAPVSREKNKEMRYSVFLMGVRPFGVKMLKMYDPSSLADPVRLR